MKPLLRSGLKHFLGGLLMGGADIVPGVSGGTMALILGIYERLIASMSQGFAAVPALLRFNLGDVRDRLRQVEWLFVLPLALGIGCAVLVGAKVIPGLLERYPIASRGLFFGLIAASLSIPWRRIAQPGLSAYGIALVAAFGAFFLVGLPDRAITDPSALQIFGAAAIAICAMILPGISGAFLLLVLGMYEATLQALNARDLSYVLLFAAGAGVGLGVFSGLLNRLLSRHHDSTMAALVGLMLGSLRALWPWLAEDRSLHLPTSSDPLLWPILFAVFGFVAVTALTWWGQRRSPADAAQDAV